MLHIIKDTSIYALGDFLTKSINFFAIILYTYFLDQEILGIYGYITVLLTFVNVFLIIGADNAYARYFFEYKNLYERRVLTTTLFFFFFLWFFIALLIPLYYAKEISIMLLDTNAFEMVILFALMSLPLKLLSSLVNQGLRNQFKTKQFIVFNLLTTVLTLSGSLALLYSTSLGLSSIFISTIIADLLILPCKLYSIKELFINKINFSFLKKILTFGLPFLPASISYWIFNASDRIMLENMCGLTNVAIYTVAISLSAIMSLLGNAVSNAWTPHAINIFETDKKTASELFIRFFHINIVMALYIIFCVAFIGKEMIILIFPEEYASSFAPLLFLTIGIGFQITTQVTALGITLMKKTTYFIYITLIVACINIGLNLLLIPFFQETGAAIGTAISYACLTFLYAYVSQRLFFIPYNIKYLILGIIALLLIVSGTLLPFEVRLMIFFLSLFAMLKYKSYLLEKLK